MAKSTFLSPFLHVTFGVLYKNSCSGLLCVIRLCLGMFQPRGAHVLQGEEKNGVLRVCPVTVCVSLRV